MQQADLRAWLCFRTRNYYTEQSSAIAFGIAGLRSIESPYANNHAKTSRRHEKNMLA